MFAFVYKFISQFNEGEVLATDSFVVSIVVDARDAVVQM